MKNRYLRFDFDTYYPAGPAGDFTGAYDDLSEAVKEPFSANRRMQHVQIIDVFELLVSHDLGLTWEPLSK